VEPSLPEAEREPAPGLRIVRGVAEHLPFGDAEFDGVICKVVTPYTDERQAIREIARVLKPGAVAVVSHHGLGYFLKYLLNPPGWKFTIYGARTLLNTWCYRLTGRRLPMPLGDTIYQSRPTLSRYYADVGLVIRERPASPTFLGAPVFIYEVLQKR
jgi:SAM-dependent methyltransferase